MGKDPSQVRAEIEQTRVQLGSDMDTLTEKVSPSKLAERRVDDARSAVTSVRDRVMGTSQNVREHGSSAAGAVGETASQAPEAVRRRAQGNPLATGLIAFGFGWLAASLLPESGAERQAAGRLREQAGHLAGPLRETAQQAVHEMKNNLQPRAHQAADSVKQSAQQAAEEIRGTAQEAGSDVAGSARDEATSVRRDVQDSAGDLRDQAGESAGQVR